MSFSGPDRAKLDSGYESNAGVSRGALDRWEVPPWAGPFHRGRVRPHVQPTSSLATPTLRRPAFVPRTTGRRQEMTGKAGASNPLVRNPIRPTPQVARSAPTTLSRWRHGFEPRWDYAGQPRCDRLAAPRRVTLWVTLLVATTVPRTSTFTCRSLPADLRPSATVLRALAGLGAPSMPPASTPARDAAAGHGAPPVPTGT
jgi:hypothetical protein